MGSIRRRLTIIAMAVATIFAVGTAGFVIIEDYPPFEAFYMTLTTVVTVGYGELLGPLSRPARIFNSFLIFFGVSVIFLAIGFLTQTIIELELDQFFGKRRAKTMIDKLHDHFILCGYGRVGRGAAEELRAAGVSFVVIDSNPERVERAGRAGLLAIAADARRDETLREAGIARARALIASLASDADNLFVILSAKTLNPSLQLCARVAEEESEIKIRRAGADHVFAPYNITGHQMAKALLKPHVQQFIEFTTKNIGLEVGIEQVRVSEGCPLAERSLGEVNLRRDHGVIVLAIRKADGRMFFNPPAEAEIQGGDYLIAMGQPDGLRKLEQMLAGVAA